MIASGVADSVVISVLIGLAVGVTGSFLAWLLVVQYLAPKICLLPDISRTETSETTNGLRYRVKFYNERKSNRLFPFVERALMEVKITATFEVSGLGGSSRTSCADLEVDDSWLAFIGAGGNRVVRVHPEATNDFSKAPFPNAVCRHCAEGTLTLEELLELDESARLRVVVTSSDAFSGSRKLYQHCYVRTDIKDGLFEGREVVIKDNSSSPHDEMTATPG